MIGNIIWSEERPGVLFKSKAQGRRSRPRALPCTTASRWSRPYDYRSCQSLFCVVISLAGGGPKHGLGLVAIGRYLTFERSSVRKLLCAPPAASPGLWVGVSVCLSYGLSCSNCALPGWAGWAGRLVRRPAARLVRGPGPVSRRP